MHVCVVMFIDAELLFRLNSAAGKQMKSIYTKQSMSPFKPSSNTLECVAGS